MPPINYSPLEMYQRQVESTLLNHARRRLFAIFMVIFNCIFGLFFIFFWNKFENIFLPIIMISLTPFLSLILLKITLGSIPESIPQLWFQSYNVNDIKLMIIKKFGSNHTNEGNICNELDTCLICSRNNEEIDSDDEAIEVDKFVKLNCTCKFKYCLNCISEWCHRTNSCPVCKELILSRPEKKSLFNFCMKN